MGNGESDRPGEHAHVRRSDDGSWCLVEAWWTRQAVLRVVHFSTGFQRPNHAWQSAKPSNASFDQLHVSHLCSL